MDLLARLRLKALAFYHQHEVLLKKIRSITLKVLMLLITSCALIGLSALVFFMCEQALISFGVASWAVIHIASAVGAAIVFLAHVATWGKESLRTVDWLEGRLPKDTPSDEQPHLPRTKTQNSIRVSLIVLAVMGTTVFSLSSYLGFLSMAVALGATGGFLLAIKVLGIACAGCMLVSAGLFAVNSMLNELDGYFERYNQKRQKTPKAKQPHDNRDEYERHKTRNITLAKVVSYILAVGNAMGDVLFKSFAFSHWLLLIGLGSIATSGAIAFTPLGVALLVIGGISTFFLSISTEGIRMITTGRELANGYNKKLKVKLKLAEAQPTAKKTSTVDRFGHVTGTIIAVLVSLLTAIPAFTSSISKVAGLGAFILFLIPGMQGVALGISAFLGTFFCISKFIGYFTQSGTTYIAPGVRSKVNEFAGSYKRCMDNLLSELPKKDAGASSSKSAGVSGSTSIADKFHSFLASMHNAFTMQTKKAPEGASPAP